jgi:LPS sulfotransferase NodH
VPAPRFASFVLFAEMRTGSNFLQANLNAMPGVTCHGELFNPHFIDCKDQTAFLGLDLAARDRDPLALLARLRAAAPGLTGFRFFHDHDARVLEAVLPDPAVAKIILARNPVESYVSWKIAETTGQWRLTDARHLRTARVTFDGSEFAARLEAQQSFRRHLLRRLQETGQTAFHIDYRDLPEVGVLNGLARFLGVPAALQAPEATLKRQNPGDIASKLTNPAEAEAALARLDLFGLSDLPLSEPTRSAALAAAVLARGAPLLHLPVRCGPEAAVTGWLGRIGVGGTDCGLTRRELRRWRRAHPRHRSFTVLRHPLERAHAAFCRRILTGERPDVRARLVRVHGLDLPSADAVADQTLAAHRAAFLGFLRFLKLDLAGQTGLRVDAAWATQSAMLQGFAQAQAPDLVLREERLAEGLAFLAGEVGVRAPAYVPFPEPAPFPLAAVHGSDLDAAAEEAYGRDYLAFGFGPWRPAARAGGQAA